MSKNRRLELEDYLLWATYRKKIKDIKLSEEFEPSGLVCDEEITYDLPF